MTDSFQPFLDQIRQNLHEPLPGRDAQFRMAARDAEGRAFDRNLRDDARRGAVLMLLYPHDPLPDDSLLDDSLLDASRNAPADSASVATGAALTAASSGQALHLPLIVRPTYDGVHSGQVALPGGGREPNDSNLIDTALREAHEEVGVLPAEVTVLGALSPLYVSASNYLIQPVVGWAAARPDFSLDAYEVAALVEAPLAGLLDARNLRRERWFLRGHNADVPYFFIGGQIVWGATAMMLSELLALPSVRALV